MHAGSCASSTFHHARPLVLVGIALTLLLSFLSAGNLAHATTACWDRESLDYSDANYSPTSSRTCAADLLGTTTAQNCAGCHSFSLPTTIGIDSRTGTQRLPAGSGSVSVTPTGTEGLSYSWRYRTSGTTGPGVWSMDSGEDIDVPAAGRTIQYCLGVNAGASRQLRCGTATFERAAADLPPVIDGYAPSGTIAMQVGAGSGVSVQLQVTDEDPAALVYTVEDVGPALTVTSQGGGRYLFEPLAEGSGTVRLVVRDADPANPAASIDVPYTVANVPEPNRTPQITDVNPPAPLALQVGGAASVVTLTVDDEDPIDALAFGTSDAPVDLGVRYVGGGRYELTPGVRTGGGELVFEVTDTEGETTELRYQIDIGPADPVTQPNRAPRITAASPPAPLALQIDGASRTVTLSVDDDDALGTLEFAVGNGPSGIDIISLGDGRFELSAGSGADGGDVVFTVTDPNGESASLSYRITIDVAEVPYAPPSFEGTDPAGPLALDIGQGVTLSVRVAAGSESAFRVSASSDAPAVLRVSPQGAGSTFRLEALAEGSAVLRLSLGDAPGGEDAIGTDETVTERDVLEVRATVRAVVVDLPPVAEPDSFVHDPDDPLLPVTGNDADPEGGALTVVLASATSERGAALSVEGTSVRYAPVDGASDDDDRFDYSVRDPAGQASDTVTVTVTASDADGDGIADRIDNCPIQANAGQENADSDDAGDVCDTTPNGETEAPTSVSGDQGVELVETVCGVCHLNPATGAPQIGDTAAWDARIVERGGIDDIVQSAINGRGGMQAFGSLYSARQLTEATLRMAGRIEEDGVTGGGSVTGEPSNPTDPTADDDGDGYPFALDDNDADARRLPLRLVQGTPDDGGNGYIESAVPLALGPVALALLAESDQQRGGVAIGEADFRRLAPGVHGGVGPSDDPLVIPRGDTLDVVARGGGAVLLRITLPQSLPNEPLLQTYSPPEGAWRPFAADGSLNALSSAPAIDGRCPPSADSPNYRDGLVTGTRCLQIALDDGGPNDTDGASDASVPIVFRVVTQRPAPNGGGGSPATVTASSGGGGGGAGAWLSLLALCAVSLGRRVTAGAPRMAAAILLPSVLFVTLPVHAVGLTALDLRAVADSNPAKAEFDRDIEASSSIAARLSANLFGGVLTDTTQVGRGYSVDASAGYGHDADIEGLGESVYRLSAGVFHESKTRAFAPFYRFGTSVSWIDSETDIRDGPALDLFGSINLQPSPFFDLSLGLGVESRQAETDVFDTTRARAFAAVNFSPAVRLVLRGGVRVVTGDEVSTATPTLDIVNSASAIEPDAAFGGADANRFAYLIDATSLILEIGAGYELTHSIQTNLLFRNVSTEADGGIAYDRDLIELTLSLDL